MDGVCILDPSRMKTEDDGTYSSTNAIRLMSGLIKPNVWTADRQMYKKIIL